MPPPTPLSAAPAAASRSQLGNLHKRRASTSPQKFNTGQFEPARLHLESPAKRARADDGSAVPTTLQLPFLQPPEKSLLSPSATPRKILTPVSAIPPNQRLGLVKASWKPPPVRKGPFSIVKALYKHNDLMLLLVSYLPVPDLINLYSVSRPFHYLFNSHHTAYILSSMRTWAPKADEVFPWRCYKSLCAKDPALRQMSKWKGKEAQKKEKWEDMRWIPSLRWLQMVIYREAVCRSTIFKMATEGLRVPRGTLDSVKRMWFMMDLPLNAHRIALVRNEEYITDETLTFLTMFFLRVDMFLTNPVSERFPQGHRNQRAYPNRFGGSTFVGVDLRQMLLAERHLTSLWRFLRGWTLDSKAGNKPMNTLDLVRLYVRHNYRVPDDAPEHVKKQSILGIPWYEVGMAGMERVGIPYLSFTESPAETAESAALALVEGLNMLDMTAPLYPHAPRLIIPKLTRKRDPMLRPDQLVMRECIRRQLPMHMHWVDMVMWGFYDVLGRPIPMYTEEELERLTKGLPAKPPKKGEAGKGKGKAKVQAKESLGPTAPPTAGLFAKMG